ncbi:Clp protease N-terminal domain-containing protein [Dactylosporangium vinaceum]|uniref:Clp protease N-terminal domain-containing protein n=1 Tax=Dactylosporangium vinaceum TaxID=53362 RepID=A0ABV5M0D1_9ACTN|nr:Clp protease N-terminal domain-containing protein [Dactylosporangium vinaceum]UAB97421.1 Clp protease N-terminal domain-containing protein [Dactylosporangium vinaceum]
MSSGRPVASLEIQVALSSAMRRAMLAREPSVSAERAADAMLGMLGADEVRWQQLPGWGASGDGVPPEQEGEVEATLRLAEWWTRRELRLTIADPLPVWDPRVRVGLGRALAAAAESPVIRCVGFRLLLRALLVECASPGEWTEFIRRFHLRPDEEFLRDGSPPLSSAVAFLKRNDPVLSGLAAPAVLRAEAVQQAVRGGCALVGQAHLVMAICALPYLMERSRLRLADDAAPTNRGGELLAEAGLTWPDVKDFAMDLSPGPADIPREERTWRVTRGDPPYGIDLYLAAQEATRLAGELGHRYVGSSHLLFAVTADGAGPGARMLRAYGVEPNALAARLGTELA